MANMIRVLLADDHPLVRSGIRSTLASELDIELVGEATNGNEAQELCSRLNPDIMLLDLSMPGPPSIETIHYAKENCPDVKVLVLTAYDDEAYVRNLVKTGVSGYLLKDEAAEALISAIRTVVQGGTWFSQAIVQKIAQWPAGVTEADNFDFTSREREILKVLAQGWSNRRIASELDLAEQTVRNYVSRVYDKLGLHSRSEAVVWARQHGFADDELKKDRFG